ARARAARFRDSTGPDVAVPAGTHDHAATEVPALDVAVAFTSDPLFRCDEQRRCDAHRGPGKSGLLVGIPPPATGRGLRRYPPTCMAGCSGLWRLPRHVHPVVVHPPLAVPLLYDASSAIHGAVSLCSASQAPSTRCVPPRV